MNHIRNDYNTYQPALPLDFVVSYDKDIPNDDISRTVNDIVERINLAKYIDFTNRDSYGYDGVSMFKCIILGKALNGYASLRDYEKLCKFDVRFKFIMHGETPSHQSFYRFIKDLTMPIDDIFIEINKIIQDDLDLNVDTLLIDGSKFEANANKMTFVWKRASQKYYIKTWKKCIMLFNKLNRYFKTNGINVYYSVLKEPSIPYLLEIAERIEQYMAANHIEIVHGKGKKKHEMQRFYEELKDYALKLYKYTIHFDICGERNSFSKTDPDATFMHMKYDYYNHTNVFKPGYNVQLGISDEFIRNIYVSSDCNDITAYIPFMKKYYAAYGEYPKKTPADAGYGSYDNYKFCKENGIELFMKYSGYYKENEKVTDKNRFKSIHMKQENGKYVCPEGYEFELVNEYTNTKGIYEKKNQTLENKHCEGCPLKSQCTKSKGNRKIVHCEDWDDMKKEVKANLTSEEGKELMKDRSIYSEGTFGIIKEDYHYNRLRRRGESGVKLEITLVAIGFNMRKYHKKMMEKNKKRESIN
jgi:transposase